MRACGIPFGETIIPLDQPDTSERIRRVSAAGKVPVLTDGDVTVWDSLAICEYLHDRFPEAGIWPKDTAARAHARSIAAEMHAGFSALRASCPMYLSKRYATRDRGEAVAADVARVETIWRETRSRFAAPTDGPFLFGTFCAADAMYAPVATRIDTYSMDVADETQAYVSAVKSHPAFVEWREAALAEIWDDTKYALDEEPIVDFRKPGARGNN